MSQEEALVLVKDEGRQPQELKYLRDKLKLNASQLENIKKVIM